MSSSLTKKATITIGGDTIASFRALTIAQSLHSYHSFELEFADDPTSPQFPFAFGDSHPLLGKKINIKIAGETTAMAKLEFDGVIAEAEGVATYRELPGVVVRGYGLPYALDTGPATNVYVEQSATDIATKCLSAYTGPKAVAAVTGPTHVLPYCVQYRETVWNFLRRLAYSYGAWLYYDGKKLNFTATPGASGSPIALELGISLERLRTGVRAVAQQAQQSDYFSLDDKAAKDKQGTNPALFATVPTSALPGRQRAVAEGDVASFTKNESASLAAAAGYVTGEAGVPGLTIGSVVSISLGPDGGGALGNFMVVEVSHRMDDALRYSNYFQAVPVAVKAMPPGPPVHYPVSEAQVGVVKDNKDPRKLGRVQVQLLWMADSDKTPWLRVLTPHYGEGKAKSRGLLFVPEIGDQVMVGFQHGDPERPFVYGAMPHGKNAAVPDPAISEHHLSVKSGSTVTFLDTDTKHELHLQVDDKNLITIVVDSGQGTIAIAGSKAVTVEAPTITLTAKQEITLDAATINLKAKQKIAIASSGGDVTLDGLNVKATGQIGVALAGNATAELKASGQTVVKGAIVMIN